LEYIGCNLNAREVESGTRWSGGKQMMEPQRIVTGLGKADVDRVLVRGIDLNEELVGKITFADMVFLELIGQMPTPEQVRMVDALLVVLVEHGLVSNVISARATYHSAPESIQGAVAASLLAAGSVHLGSSEWSAKMLADAFTSDDRDTDSIAMDIIERFGNEKIRIAGIGHRTHSDGDPRARRLFQVARETGVYGRHCELLERVSVRAGERAGRLLPVNVTGAIGAIALDLGLPWQMTKAFALIGRTLGAMAHIGEEIRNPMATTIDAVVRGSLVYEPDVQA
jgi:citrate synthase